MTKRQTGLTMSPIDWAYVEAIRLTGTHGDMTSTVLRSLIMQSVRQAIADRLIERIRP